MSGKLQMALLTIWIFALKVTAVGAQDYAGAGRGLDLDTLRVPRARYVGNQACKECHISAYDSWLGSKHARSYVLMNTGTGRVIAAKMDIEAANIARSVRCLVCHATAADVVEEFRIPDFRFEEGVKCEHCHGPGGEHVRVNWTLERRAVAASRMKQPSEEDCMVCHKEKVSHEILDVQPFSFEKASKRIAHRESRREKLELLGEHPAAVLSIGLRNLLSNFFLLIDSEG